MAASGEGGKMEGWLYLVRSNRFGLQYSKKRYFVLQDNRLNCFRAVPASTNEAPVRIALIDPCIRITDNGREKIKKNVFFIFTVYNTFNHNDQLKLGAKSSEEAARWRHCLMEAALKECPNKGDLVVACSKRWKSFSSRLRFSRGSSHSFSTNWTCFSSFHTDPMTSDVIAPSPWTIFGCKNGLRLFKEAKDRDCQGKCWDDHPAIMAVGVVDEMSEAVFRTVMSLGPSRSEWDFCFSNGSVVEHLDGHTDIIHKKLTGDWFPWGMSPRDLLLQRYWRREDDGTYVILYHSVFHESCRPVRGYVRACLKSGGYVISPVNDGKQSVVKHMLAIDWKSWMSYLFTSSAKEITINMLGRVAALRELFRAKREACTGYNFFSGELSRPMQMSLDEASKSEARVTNEHDQTDTCTEQQRSPAESTSVGGSILQLNDATDEFFDTVDESECDPLDGKWSLDSNVQSQDQRHAKMSSAVVFVKRLHGLAAQKKGYMDLRDDAIEETCHCNYGTTLVNDPSCSMACTWSTSDPSTFLIRSKTYLQDHIKTKANGTLMQMVAADWLKSDKREDDLGGRSRGIVQKYAAKGGDEFFFIVNIQVPGATTHCLALYYMMDAPIESVPLLHNFVQGDDAYRNSRFKLIPYISKGSWIVKQSVGKKACLIGQALEMNYFHGKNYIELGVDIGSSTVARGVVSLVLGYLTNLVIEMAFLIQGNTPDELPEFLLGTCRLNHLDASKAIQINPPF